MAKSLPKLVAETKFSMLLLLFGMLAALACTPSEAKLLEGLLQNVDSVSGEVTIQLKDGGTVTVNLQDVDVEALRQGAGAVSLGTGDPVTLEMDRNDEVRTLKAHVTELEGIITGIDPVAKTITINDGSPLTVASETKIEIDDINDKDATFDALSIGQEVEVKLDTETGRVLKVEVEDEDIDEGGLKGTLIAVDSVAQSVTIRARNGTEAVYFFKPDTKLKLSHGRVGIFADLVPLIDSEVEAKYDQATNNLLKLKVENEDGDEGEVEGTLIAVDTVAENITIRAENGTEDTYSVRLSTRLEVDDRKGVLADLVPLIGAEVEAKFNQSTKDLFKLEAENAIDDDDDGDVGDNDGDDDREGM